MIDREHDLSITRQAKLLGISRGTVYYLPRPVSPADLALMRRIDELHLEHPFMGARMLRRQLADLGMQRRQVHRIWSRAGLEDLGCAIQQLPLPFGDLVRMQFKLLAQLGHRAIFPQSGQRHLRLEHRRVGAAVTPR